MVLKCEARSSSGFSKAGAVPGTWAAWEAAKRLMRI